MCDCYREYGIYEAERDIDNLTARMYDLERETNEFIPEIESLPHLHFLYQEEVQSCLETKPWIHGSLEIWSTIERLLSEIRALQQEVNSLKEQLLHEQ
jgi:hypothetical protein